MNDRSAVIIVDTGYSLESLQLTDKILAILDVRTGSVISGYPYLTWEHNEDVLRAFAGDELNHGSMVLEALYRQAPNTPVVLIRAYNEKGLIRTTWHKGRIARPGWTEAYLTAVHICQKLGLNSVANFSFGGYTHAADGTGWESHCLSTVLGAGKPGHIAVAGAGTGTGANIHASWRTERGQTTEIKAHQDSDATYNLWCSADARSPQYNDWLFEAFLDGEKVGQEFGADLIPNLWNNRKQVTFHIEGAGEVTIRTTRIADDSRIFSLSELANDIIATTSSAAFSTANGARAARGGIYNCMKKPYLSLVKKQVDAFRFDCWINQLHANAYFLDHNDPMLIAEPAIFPHVISVGLTAGQYSIDQNEIGAKPDLLIEGDGPISFRLPEIAAEIAAYLAADPTLDAAAVRKRIKNLKAA